MDCKLVVLFLLIGISDLVVNGDHGKDPGHYRKKKIDAKCGTDTLCIAAAEKCLGDKDAPPPTDNMTGEQKLEAFNTCLQDNGKEADIINEADCRGGGSGNREARHRHEVCKKEIFTYIDSLEEAADPSAGQVRCCFFQAIGMDMVSSDNSINLPFFREHLEARISNQGVLDVYEAAFDACVPKGEMCNVHGFRECVMDECISRMQN